MLNINELKSKSISEIKSFLKENGSVFVEKNKNKLTIQHLYVSNDDINSLEISNKLKFKEIEKNVWFLEYNRDYVENLCYYLFKNCNNVKGDERENYIIDDIYSKNKLNFYDKNGNIYFTQSYILPVPQLPKLSLFEEKHKIYSKILQNEYEIIIVYPKNHNKNSNTKCLIVTDGEVWHYSLHLAEQVNKIDDFLVCFILQQDRNKELPSKNFANFIATELTQFLIDNNFVKNDKNNFYFWGQSFGGLTALYIDKNYSEYIGNVICTSPSLWFKNNNFLDYYKNNLPKTNFHLSYGNADFKPIQNKTKILAKYIEPIDTTIFKGGHDYLSWNNYFLHTLKNIIIN